MFVLLFLTLILCLSPGLASEMCLAEGFAPTVSCRTCGHFNAMITVYQKCKECCKEDSGTDAEAVKKYNLVVLEVDKRFVEFYPDFLIAFIAKIKKQKKKKKSNSNMLIRYQFGSRPALLCYENKDDELPAENLSIQSWDDDTLQDFLKTHLVDNENEEKKS